MSSTIPGLRMSWSARTQAQLEDAIRAGKPVVTEDAMLIARSEHVDVIVDTTGSVEFGAQVALEAFKHRKDVVMMNAEIDATIGPILQTYAAKHGVILSACDGDEPGIQMNLYRWVKGLGLIPRVMGNIKGLQDPYRNPTTQKGFAEKWGQNPAMVTSFADGSKISFEQAIVANATGLVVKSRGMSRGAEYKDDVMKIGALRRRRTSPARRDRGLCRRHAADESLLPGRTPRSEAAALPESVQNGRRPAVSRSSFPIIWFTSRCPMPSRAWCCSAIRLAKPLGGPVVEVCAVAKRDLKAGEMLDDYGMYMTYGEAVNADEMCRKRYLPEGLVEGCKLKRGHRKDAVITYDDVELPPNRLADRLRAEQYRHFRGETWLEELVSARPESRSVE